MVRTRYFQILSVLLVGASLGPGCSSDSDSHSGGVEFVTITGANASDFISLAAYLSDPAVEELLNFMPRHEGAAPPNVDGAYFASGSVDFSTIPGSSPGVAVDTEFCLGPPAAAALEVAILDAGVVDAGALSFIEGSGDLFTVYTAFKSVQIGPNGGTCEIHQVLILSGTSEADGSLSSLFVGIGIVGLVGDCGDLLIDQIQVSVNTGNLTGPSCVGGGTPVNPAEVLVEVDNLLVTDMDIFVNGNFVGTAPLLSALIFEASPGFTLQFESAPPLNEFGDPMGEVIVGEFVADPQPAGRFSQFLLSNLVGDDFYFAPIVTNQSSTPVTVQVNVGTPLALDCMCSLPPSALAEYLLGYHFYDAPGLITAGQTNVAIDGLVLGGPFTLGLDSGTLNILVTDTEVILP